jgi:predicted nucleotidyltransferase
VRPTSHPQSALRYPLSSVLGREANIRVLRAIFLSDIPIGVSDLARRTRLQASGVARVCTKLEELDVIEAVGRGARFRQYRRAKRFPLASALAQMFAEERRYAEEALREITAAVRMGRPLQAAWIEGPVALSTDRPADAVVIGLLTEPVAVEAVRRDRWQRLMPIQSERNLTIELKVLTIADLKAADAKRRAELEQVILIVGPPPLDLAAVREPSPGSRRVAESRTHGQLDARAMDIARAVGERIGRDPSLVEDAKRYIERRLPSASPGERLELEEWQSALASMSTPRLRRFLTQDSERATRLRQSLPFLEALTEEERKAIFAAAARRESAGLTLTTRQRSALAALCRRHHVRQLDLFGSAARGTFDPARSDLDFVVSFDALPPADFADAFFGLQEALVALFGRPVDLLTAESIRNPYLRESIERTRQVLYAA